MRSVEASLLHDRAPGRAFTACAAAFVLAAAIVGAVHATTPISHGWWLVAYLGLVGGLSQALLGPGLAAIVERTGARGSGSSAICTELVLWNLGTVIVAVADLAVAPAGVLTGSALLLVALGFFAVGLHNAVAADASRRLLARGWIAGYVLLLAFLGSSVVVGSALAGALPGQ